MKISIKQSTIKAVAQAMAKNDIRRYLNGVYIETNGRETCVVASDGHRLNVARSVEEMIILREALADYKRFIRPADTASEQRKKNYATAKALHYQFSTDVQLLGL